MRMRMRMRVRTRRMPSSPNTIRPCLSPNAMCLLCYRAQARYNSINFLLLGAFREALLALFSVFFEEGGV